MKHRYSAMYYPDCFVGNLANLTTYLLLYDELHLVAMSDDSKNPTEKFRTLPKYTVIKSFKPGQDLVEYSVSATEIRSKGEPGELDEQTKRTLLYYQFIQRNKELIGDAIFFHPHLWASAVNRITGKLLGGGLGLEEFYKFITSQDAEMGALADFQRKNPSIQDAILQRTVPTATKLAEENGYILIGDKSNTPFPALSQEVESVRKLTAILAEECVKLYVPKCQDASPDAILEIRESLKDHLVPFRMSLQRLSTSLRSAIDSESNMEDIRKEAKFIAESQIEPAVYELKMKIEKANSKLFNRVFGKVLSWIPYIAKAYALPTPDNILEVAKRVGADSGSLLDGVDEFSYTRNHGLCFLLKLEDAFNKNVG